MRTIALFFLMILAAGALSQAHASEAEIITSINKAADALDTAFEKQDAPAIRELMTPDHVAITPYYDGPQSLAEQIGSLRDLKYGQMVLGKVQVDLLGGDVALRSFTASLKGSFKGKPLPPRVYIGEIWVKHKGRWAEKFYQVTTVQPARPAKTSACSELMGTYLTKNAAKGASEGSAASRSLISFGSGGLMLFTDSGEGGEAGFAPFTDGRGAWRCIAGEKGDAKIRATTLDFTEPGGSDPKGEIGRLDFDLAYDPEKKMMKGSAVLYLLPLSADPLKPGKPGDGRQFEIVSQRVGAQ